MQLPKSTLISRYYETRDAAQRRLVDYTGYTAVAQENLRQLVLFGSGKRCGPVRPYSVACYATPNSPLPKSLYGANTDTMVGTHIGRQPASGTSIPDMW